MTHLSSRWNFFPRSPEIPHLRARPWALGRRALILPSAALPATSLYSPAKSASWVCCRSSVDSKSVGCHFLSAVKNRSSLPLLLPRGFLARLRRPPQLVSPPRKLWFVGRRKLFIYHLELQFKGTTWSQRFYNDDRRFQVDENVSLVSHEGFNIEQLSANKHDVSPRTKLKVI